MIKQGMKAGEVFEDGGLYYEVQSVLPNGNYISKRVSGPKKSRTDDSSETLGEEAVKKATVKRGTRTQKGE